MKKIMTMLIALLSLSLAGSGIIMADASETSAITDAKNSLMEMSRDETIDPVEYKEILEVINDIVISKNLEDVPATVTFTEAQDFDKLETLEKDHDIVVDSLEVRLLKDGEEVFTAFIKNTELSDSERYLTSLSLENDLEIIGIVSANLTADSAEVNKLQADKSIFSVDTSAADFIEEKTKTEENEKVAFPKSLAWELENQ